MEGTERVIRRINRKSDFDFLLGNTSLNGSKVDIFQLDWRAIFTTDNVDCYEASNIGGVLTNCTNEDGKIHFIFKNHNLGAGVLKMESFYMLPNPLYPTGTQMLVNPIELGYELWDGASDGADKSEVEVMLPYIYIRAAEDIRDLTQILDTANEQAEEILGTTLGEYDASDYATDARLIKGVLNATNADNVEVLKSLMLDMADDTLIYLSISDTNEWKSGNPRATFATALAQFVTHAPYTYDGTTFNGIGTTSDSLGASVGDLLCIMRYSNGGNSLWEMKVVPLNDAKPANGDFPGSDGLETIWDKTQVNKVPGIEVGLNWHTEIFSRSLDERSFSTNTDGGYNINNCLTTGIYTGCSFGRSMADNHSDERYTVTVQTHWNESERMYYVQQHAYSENYPNRAFFRLIKTNDLSNVYGDYGQWYQIGYQNS